MLTPAQGKCSQKCICQASIKVSSLEMIGFNRLTLRLHLIGGYDRLFGQSLSVPSADDFRNLTRSRIFEFLRDARPMNRPETATDATRRLEMRLRHFRISRTFIHEIAAHS